MTSDFSSDDSRDRPDETSDPYPQAAGVPSEESLDSHHAYTTKDGALYVTGKLHLKILDEHGTEQNIFIKILLSPANMHSFNDLTESLKNTVLIDAHIAHWK